MNFEDIAKIIKLVEESTFDSMQLEYNGFNLSISKSGPVSGRPMSGQPEAHAVPAASKPEGASQKTSEAIPVHKSDSGGKGSETNVKEEDGLVTVKAPMVGVFYVAPEPGAAPFVSVGSKVDEDTNVGLIEVMKVFSAVLAGVKGEIVKCCVENAQLVEYDQTLFLVRTEKRE